MELTWLIFAIFYDFAYVAALQEMEWNVAILHNGEWWEDQVVIFFFYSTDLEESTRHL